MSYIAVQSQNMTLAKWWMSYLLPYTSCSSSFCLDSYSLMLCSQISLASRSYSCIRDMTRTEWGWPWQGQSKGDQHGSMFVGLSFTTNKQISSYIVVTNYQTKQELKGWEHYSLHVLRARCERAHLPLSLLGTVSSNSYWLHRDVPVHQPYNETSL